MSGFVIGDATDVLAEALFYAEMGHTGMTWDDCSDHYQDEWKRKVGKMLDAFHDPGNPFLVIDLSENTISRAS